MGFKVAWAAVRGVDPAVVRETFGLRSHGHANEYDVIDDDVYGLVLGEWYVIVANTSYRVANPYHLQIMPLDRVTRSGGEAIGCFVNETVMHSGGCGWLDGEERWTLYHDGGNEGVDHLEIEGTPPEPFAEIEARLREQQRDADGVDYVFDVPVELGFALVGYRHNRSPDADTFERLERV